LFISGDRDDRRINRQSLEVVIMKSLIHAVVVAAALTVPALSFAQSNGPLTRAQVRAELIQLEQAGYQPGRANDAYYPDGIQAAMARVASQNAVAQTQPQPGADVSGYGADAHGTSGSGAPRSEAPAKPTMSPLPSTQSFSGS
jgi:hypothetical protein